MDEKKYVELRGTVEQIVFSNEENGYAVLRLLSQEGAEITATGTFPGIGLGEELTMVGCWVMHPSYGEQFSAERFERRLPTTVRGIADYLSSGLISRHRAAPWCTHRREIRRGYLRCDAE